MATERRKGLAEVEKSLAMIEAEIPLLKESIMTVVRRIDKVNQHLHGNGKDGLIVSNAKVQLKLNILIAALTAIAAIAVGQTDLLKLMLGI